MNTDAEATLIYRGLSGGYRGIVRGPRVARGRKLVRLTAATLAPAMAFCVRFRSCRMVDIIGAAANVEKKVMKNPSLRKEIRETQLSAVNILESVC